MNWVTLRAALHAWVVRCTGLSTQKVMWARQLDAPRPERDAIIMKIYVADDVGMSWVDTEEVVLTFANKTITAVSGNNLTITAHDLRTGDGPIWLEGADLPAPLAEETNYWVIRVDANTIQLSAQFEDTGGDPSLISGNIVTPITLTDAGSGSMTLVALDKTLRAGQEIEFVQRGQIRMTLQLFSYVENDTGNDGAIAILRRINNRYLLPSNAAILKDAGLAVIDFDRPRSMLGTRDGTLFEPRAWVDIHLNLAFEEREYGTIIGRVEVTREDPAPYTDTIENEDL